MEQSFIAYIENSIKNNWDLDALTDYKGATLQYKDVARKIEKLHIIFEQGRQDCRLRKKQFALGCDVPRHIDIRSGYRPYSS